MIFKKVCLIFILFQLLITSSELLVSVAYPVSANEQQQRSLVGESTVSHKNAEQLFFRVLDKDPAVLTHSFTRKDLNNLRAVSKGGKAWADKSPIAERLRQSGIFFNPNQVITEEMIQKLSKNPTFSETLFLDLSGQTIKENAFGYLPKNLKYLILKKVVIIPGPEDNDHSTTQVKGPLKQLQTFKEKTFDYLSRKLGYFLNLKTVVTLPDSEGDEHSTTQVKGPLNQPQTLDQVAHTLLPKIAAQCGSLEGLDVTDNDLYEEVLHLLVESFPHLKTLILDDNPLMATRQRKLSHDLDDIEYELNNKVHFPLSSHSPLFEHKTISGLKESPKATLKEIFTKMIRLEVLSLRHCGINDLAFVNDDLSPSNSLKSLDLSENGFFSLNSLNGFYPKLETLTLSTNQLPLRLSRFEAWNTGMDFKSFFESFPKLNLLKLRNTSSNTNYLDRLLIMIRNKELGPIKVLSVDPSEIDDNAAKKLLRLDRSSLDGFELLDLRGIKANANLIKHILGKFGNKIKL